MKYPDNIVEKAKAGERPFNRCLCRIEYDVPCPYCKHYVLNSRPRKPGVSGVGIGETDVPRDSVFNIGTEIA